MTTTTATPTFRYEVLDGSGEVRSGSLEAESEAAVVARLHRMGYTPLSVSAKPTTGMHKELSLLPKRVRLKDLAIMSRQFATMIGAGLSLLRVLGVLAEQTENSRLAEALRTIRGDVETGAALSDALGRHPKIFPPLMVSMVQAGEVGGFLDRALESVADNLEAEVKLRSKVKSAMTYPIVVGVVAVLLVTAMLLFIVPTFRDLFADLGGTLPLPTRIVVWMSDVAKIAAPVLLVLSLVGAGLWGKFRNEPRVRDVVDPIKLKVPVFGKLFRKVYLARTTRNLSAMLGAGVPMLQAIDVVSRTTGSVVVSRALDRVRDAIRTGEGIAAPMAEEDIFPPMTVQMIAVGEDSGSIDEMLAKVADFYDQEVEATTESLTTLVEPVMMLFLGGIVGFMVISLYMPIFKIFELVR
jgi:type IV pilus assembly protein PilC